MWSKQGGIKGRNYSPKHVEVGSDLEKPDVSSVNKLWGNHEVFESWRSEGRGM